LSDQNNKPKADNDDVVDLSGFDTSAEGETAAAGENDHALKAELEKAKNDYLYLRADFDNYRRGVIKERADLIKYGSERLLSELLDLLDNFDRALTLEVTAENLQSFKEGMDLTRKGFDKVLSKFGVASLDCEGKAFDPSLHEALSSEETDSMAPGHITRVFKKAYKLHDKLIRPAQVVVAKEPPKE
jgi:molecular chaperone GrpE